MVTKLLGGWLMLRYCRDLGRNLDVQDIKDGRILARDCPFYTIFARQLMLLSGPGGPKSRRRFWWRFPSLFFLARDHNDKPGY
jgi:hypothetical protein